METGTGAWLCYDERVTSYEDKCSPEQNPNCPICFAEPVDACPLDDPNCVICFPEDEA